jgi:hypothetical protein
VIDGPATPTNPAAPGDGDPPIVSVPIGDPPTSLPRVPPRFTPRTRTAGSSRTYRPSTAPELETDVPTAALSFGSATFDFAPTIAGAGRRLASFELSGTSSSTAVSSVGIGGANGDSFTVESSSCIDATIGAGTTCSVDVAFAPATTGALTADLVAQTVDGSIAVVALSGIGAPAPTIAVVPAVAAPSQVVTVVGGGFPAGATVAMWFGERTNTIDVAVDEGGAVVATFVVDAHRTVGPMAVGVAAQSDAFGEVRGSLLVDGSGSRSSRAVYATDLRRLGGR